MENILFVAQNNIKVKVRMNLSNDNYEDLICLIGYIKEILKNNRNLSVIVKSLFVKIRGKSKYENIGYEQEMIKKQGMLNSLLFDKELIDNNIQQSLKYCVCPANSGDLITVLPDGSVGLCEHYDEKNKIGMIDGNFNLKDEVKKFGFEKEECYECIHCPILPECNRQKYCDCVSDFCSDDRRKMLIEELKYKILMRRKEYED